MENYLFTSEAVTEGYPDKICDKIANTLAKRLHDVSKTNSLLKPDDKTQVIVEYKNGLFKDIKNLFILKHLIMVTLEEKSFHGKE